MSLNAEQFPFANPNERIDESGSLATIERLKLCCRLCLCPDQDVNLNSVYQNSVKYIDVAIALMNIEVMMLIYCLLIDMQVKAFYFLD